MAYRDLFTTSLQHPIPKWDLKSCLCGLERSLSTWRIIESLCELADIFISPIILLSVHSSKTSYVARSPQMQKSHLCPSWSAAAAASYGETNFFIRWFLHKTLQPQQTNLDTNEIFAFVKNTQRRIPSTNILEKKKAMKRSEGQRKRWNRYNYEKERKKREDAAATAAGSDVPSRIVVLVPDPSEVPAVPRSSTDLDSYTLPEAGPSNIPDSTTIYTTEVDLSQSERLTVEKKACACQNEKSILSEEERNGRFCTTKK
ncbi:hypothetical protein OUZ56_032109 [Daphnia magna]|uniref:Uncharacterized protein n=1 Tax=Daphnia magna TaxID=35525 RepID=A0ABQ9ZW68_9CRUS|nr:hypothetical protein OUZ56_032109 [Daphnia magna]